MKKSRILAAVLAATMTLGIVACGGSGSGSAAQTPASSTSEASKAEESKPVEEEKKEESKPVEEEKQEVSDGDVIEITFAHDKALTHPVHLRYEAWAKDLEEATNGRVKITFYPAQTMLSLGEMYEGVTQDIADITVVTPSVTPGVFPMLEIFDLPAKYVNDKVLSQTYWDILHEYDFEELSKVHVLNVYCMGPGAIANAKDSPIETMEDLNGKQIRALGLSGDCLAACGISPVSVAMPEVYEAMMRGVCDGMLGGHGAVTTWNLTEVSKSVTDVPFLSVSAFIVMMNKEKWDSLPEDIQQAFDEVCQKHNDLYVQGETDEMTKAFDTYKEMGMPVYFIEGEEQEKWIEKMQPVVEQALADKAQYGPAEEVYARIQELTEKYGEGEMTHKEYWDSIQ